jgi:hypothetical protein
MCGNQVTRKTGMISPDEPPRRWFPPGWFAVKEPGQPEKHYCPTHTALLGHLAQATPEAVPSEPEPVQSGPRPWKAK